MGTATHTLEEDLRDPSRPTVILKPKAGKHTATVIILHGLGDSARGWQSGAELFAGRLPHAKFILPTAPNIPITLQAGMPASAWCDIPIRSPLEIQNAIALKPGHIDASVCEIAKIIRQEALSGVPPSRVAIVGFSLGGCAAAWTALQLLFPCAGLVMLSSAVLGDVNIKLSSVCSKVPVLQCHGSADFMIPLFGAKLSQQRMEASGVSVTFHEFSGGHEVSQEVIGLTCQFLTERLPDVDTSAPELVAESAKAGEAGALLPAGLEPDVMRIADDVPVTIRGLKSQPQHNGVVGTVVGFNATSSRYTVRLEGVDAPLALKPQNVTAHVRVSLSDGACGLLVDWDEEAASFVVRVAADATGDAVSGGEEERRVLPEQLRLPKGTAVRVVGLTSEKGQQLNERLGKVQSFNEEEQRYVVDLGGERHKIRPANLLP